MQSRAAERELRDLFHALLAQGEVEAATGVWLAAGRLGLNRTPWDTRLVQRAAQRVRDKLAASRRS